LERFERDGVDSSQVAILPDQTTGVAFIAYFTGGSRKFIYHWRHAAAASSALNTSTRNTSSRPLAALNGLQSGSLAER